MIINGHLRLILLQALFNYKNKHPTYIEFCSYSFKKMKLPLSGTNPQTQNTRQLTVLGISEDSISWPVSS